jgi:hypothetical protein
MGSFCTTDETRCRCAPRHKGMKISRTEMSKQKVVSPRIVSLSVSFSSAANLGDARTQAHSQYSGHVLKGEDRHGLTSAGG